MSGVFDWLDTLTQTAGQVAGQAVNAAASVANNSTAAAAAIDQTRVPYTSPVQTAIPGGSYAPWIIGGVVVILAVWLIARKS